MKKSDLKKILMIGAAVTAAAAVTAVAVSKYRKSKSLKEEYAKSVSQKNAYITGGGISALAAALYLVRDCGFAPSNVHIFTNTSYNHGDEQTGYICRRGKIISEKNSMNFFDLMSGVSSLDIPDLTVCDEILNIYRANPNSRNITFVDSDKNVVDISNIRIDKSHRKIVMQLMQEKKENLVGTPVCDVMPSEFFESPFWKLLCAAYGFSRESSAYEFVNCIAHMDDMLSGTLPADFDRHEEIIEPLTEHLKKLGVDLRERAVVTDMDFEDGKADAVHFTDNGVRKTVYLNDGDICIFPTDEMAECAAYGSFNEAPPKLFSAPYSLWERLSEKNPAFQNPSKLFDDFDANMSEEFTITLSNRLLPELIDEVTCGALGSDGVIVLDNSSWKLTICAVPSTHFKNQSEDIAVIWGCASRFDRDGERCGKPMTECGGAEILYELVSCFNLDDAWDDIRETVINVIPCHRKYDKSPVAPVDSKLEIIPTGIENFAVSGDFADSGKGTVFSEEYAVSTARAAAYRLMNTNKKIFEPKKMSYK
ncbi:MAG: oleate hydratase, partial [Firmicutes bacterium]|nr:oleate hydratase [Bacillota bacterium]